MTESTLEISSQEATALLTCLEYYLLKDLQDREKSLQGMQHEYEPIPDIMLQTLNGLRNKLLHLVRDS